jgi:two-component system, NtrC family, response regulator HydG
MTAPAATDRLPVLLVDDDAPFLLSSSVALRAAGIDPVVTLQDSRQVMPYLAGNGVATVVVDLAMPHLTGHELLRRIREEFPQLPVLVLTGTNEVAVAVACMKDGAFDYMVKPVETSRFVSSIRRALEIRGLRDEISTLKQRLLSGRLSDASAFSGIVTDSRKMLALFQYVEVVAATAHPILITGETGTGKELIAQAVHALSGCRGPFLPVNVAGLDDAMFSDTLFGHRRGAFTGADQAREGLIAQAAGGTLFLDEIGDLKESSQVKLLRLLDGGRYYPLGSDVPRQSDTRIVCATHRNLQELLAAGTFRKDLYYRLSAHQVHLPPLRERPEDIPLLVDCFLEEAAASQRKKKPVVPPELFTLLSSCPFPGNVRELRALVFDAMIQHKGGSLSVDPFRKAVRGERTTERAGNGSEEDGAPFRIGRRFPTLKEAESHLIAVAMRRARNNQGIAATLLGITRQALNKRLVRGPSRKKSSEDAEP